DNNGKGTLWSHRAVSNFLGGTTHVDPHGYFARWGYNWDDCVKLVTKKHRQLIENQKASTSKLGKVKTAKAKIYENPTEKSNYIEAGSTHTDKVFYIKAQAKVNNQVFYLISNKPSSKNGTVGWVNDKDITTYSHVAVDNKSKTFYLKGKVLRTTERGVDLKIKSLTAMILPKWKVTRFMFIRLKLSETTRGIVGIIMAKEYGSMKTTW